MTEPSASIRVNPAPAGDAAYDVIVGPGVLARIGEIARVVAPAARYAIIADLTVANLYGDTIRAALSGVAPTVLFAFPAGETHKTRETWAGITDALLAAGMGRDACVVALGGGVTGDLAGFVAATYMRGLPWIQVPTSLLAMIDASVGGKTGVDVPGGKNLVGAFTQPRAVLADPAVLTTLPADAVREGLAEAIKHGVIADAQYLDWIEANVDVLVATEPEAATRLVRRSVEIKAQVVSRDPHERGERAILNFGHTLAHAIERVSRYAVPHGRAVAAGMVLEARIGEVAGITEAGTADRIARALRAAGLPDRLPERLSARDLLEAATSDKKARAARIRWALIARIGAPARGSAGEWTVEVPRETVLAVLDS